MRIFLAALLGAIVLFVWSALAHMLLPIGEMSMKTASNQDAAIAALQASADSGAGVYMLPGMAPEQWRDEAAMGAFVEKYKASPSAFVVYQPTPNPSMSTMTPALAKQFVSSLVATLLTAWILALGGFSFGQRVAVGTAIGVVAWFLVSVPYWNWYCFPLGFTVAAWLDWGIGMALASVVMAWWLGRRTA
jgi:hypothetical protein